MYIFLSIAMVVVAAIGVCRVWDRFSQAAMRRENPPEKIAAERRAFEQRLLQPDWEFYEKHLGRPAPAALRELFSDHRLLMREDLEYDEGLFLSTFEPLDETGLKEAREWLGFDAMPFANSESDLIYIRPGAAESDAVYITYHDGGETEQLAPDTGVFLTRVREAAERPAKKREMNSGSSGVI